MPASPSVTAAKANPVQLNELCRSLLLKQQIPHSISLGTFNLQAGQQLSIKPKNVGLVIGFSAIVKFSATVAATSTLSKQGNQGAHCLLNRVQMNDIDGVSRINASAFEIGLINAANVRQKQLSQEAYIDYDNSSIYLTQNALVGNDVKIDNTAHTVKAGLFLDIPLCLYKYGDLAGMMNLQSVLGDAYLLLTPPSLSALFTNTDNDFALVKSDVDFATTSPTVTSFTVEIVQHYYMAQQYPIGDSLIMSLPELDISTVYAIEGAVLSSDNIVANQEKQISYPNNRNIRKAVYTFYNGGILGGSRTPQQFFDSESTTDVVRCKLLTGAGDYFADMTSTMFYALQKQKYGVDFGRGVFMPDYSLAPISTSFYGTVQSTFVAPPTLSGTPQFGICYESHYMKGASLANVTQ